MIYIKNFENIFNSNTPKIGDFFVCKLTAETVNWPRSIGLPGPSSIAAKSYLDDFLSQNIGQCVDKSSSIYIIKYDNAPDSIYFINNRFYARNENIVHWSKNKKDLEIYIDMNKYNL